MQAAEIALAYPDQTRNRRTRSIPGMARKLAELSNQMVDAALRDEANNKAQHERVRALAELASGGAFGKILKASPLLNDADKKFLSGLGYIP